MASYLGVDLGTRNIEIWQQGKGIVLREPSVAAVDTKGNVLAVGTEALLIYGRAPGTVTLRRPIENNSVTDFALLAEMLDRVLEGTAPKTKKHIKASVKYSFDVHNRELLKKAFGDCHTGKVELVDAPLAALAGCGYTPAEDEAEAFSGTVICDIGAGSIEVSYIRSGELLRCEVRREGGDAADTAILTHIRSKYDLAITPTAAREAKHLLSLYVSDEKQITLSGTDTATGMPRKLTLHSDELLACCAPQIDGTSEAISALISNLPRHGETVSSFDRVILIGGGAMLPGIGEYLEKALGVSITVPESPLDCTVNGLGVMIGKENL